MLDGEGACMVDGYMHALSAVLFHVLQDAAVMT
jgi:hypothetical protein